MTPRGVVNWFKALYQELGLDGYALALVQLERRSELRGSRFSAAVDLANELRAINPHEQPFDDNTVRKFAGAFINANGLAPG